MKAKAVRNILQRCHRVLSSWTRALIPSTWTARWIRLACLVGVVLMGGWFGAFHLHLGFGAVVNILAGALVAAGVFAISWLVLLAGLALAKLTVGLVSGAGVAAVPALLLILGLPVLPGLPAAVALSVILVLSGAGLALALRARPLAALAAVLPALAAALAISIWTFGATAPDDPVASYLAEYLTDRPADVSGHAELSKPGGYAVATATYGSGTDRHRAEFGPDADWNSEAVDGSVMLGDPEGLSQRLRNAWWGFDPETLPVNGRVWYAEDAEGPRPMVLVVHGNHDMMRFSDPGYDWLGEHLASRGMVVVSVDQNFLNASLFGGLARENAARGWLMLEHLRAWRQWQAEPAHPLHEQVDLERVVLAGHSRGGEAVALAAAFNELDHFPEDARQEFDFGFGIRGVAAIAPVDGQFRPSGRSLELSGIHYLTLHGGHDADVSSFQGDRQYARVQPDPARNQYRATIYMHHANHGQFNRIWGDSDTWGPARFLLNRAGLMSGEDQRRAARLFLTAFIEDSLAGSDEHFGLFCAPWTAGNALPDTLFTSRCHDGARRVLADFEEDLDLGTATLAGARLSGHELALWSEDDVGFRGSGSRDQTGAWLAWHQDSDPGWSIRLDEQARQALVADEDSVLWLDLAHADRAPPASEAPAGDQEIERNDEHALRPPLDIRIELTDRDGNRAQAPLERFARLHPPLPVQITRLSVLENRFFASPTEPLLQSVAIPLDSLEGDLDPARLESIRLRFNAEHEGVLIVERVELE